MEGPNDAAEKTFRSKEIDSLSAELVTGKKLLTREEECTLKTALAFVVIKARARAKSKAEASENLSSKANGSTKINEIHKSFNNDAHNDTSHSSTICDSSILDHLLSHNFEARLPTECQPLECKGGQEHMEYMFRAAKTLAETWIVTGQKSRSKGSLKTNSLALQGATGHLAHQLQLLLVASANGRLHEEENSLAKTSSVPSTVKNQTSRYRRFSLSSKSAADSSSTPSSSFRTTKEGNAPVFVTPSTSQSQSIHDDNNGSGGEYNSKHATDEASFVVQDWIRATLLGDDKDSNNTTQRMDSRTVLSCQNISVLDIQSSFYVYNVMIPQLARISPPLIGHIFQVVAGLLKDLYGDKIMLVGENRLLLDHLATSSLGLLELCWTTEITVGTNRDKDSHRSFLLLSLQEIMGNLLVPLSRQKLAAEHYRLTLSEAHLCSKFRQPAPWNGFPRSSDPQYSRTSKRRRFLQKERLRPPGERKRNLLPQNSFALPRVHKRNEVSVTGQFQALKALDPEAKLLLRMAVYRLILMKRKG